MFQATTSVTAAFVTTRFDNDVSELAGHRPQPTDNLAANNDPAAYAGAEREEGKILDTLTSTHVQFT